MANLGVHVYEEATAVATPVTAASGVPYFVGTAPVQAAESPALVNAPVLCTSWDEAVEKLGYSDDWEDYTLCEAMYSHFQLYACQPAIFCNVLSTDNKKALAEKDYAVTDHQVILPFGVINDSSLVVKNLDAPLVKDTDYIVMYDGNECVLELLSDSSAYEATSLNIAGNEMDLSSIESVDIAVGVGTVDACMSTVGVVPDLILAPGWSSETSVAALMATKAAGINSLFGAKALIDFDCSSSGVTEYSQLWAAKNENNFVDVNQVLCWPMQKLGDYRFHMSTQLAGLMASVDTTNGGVPYESPSNKSFKMDGLILEDGTEVSMTFEQANIVAGYGIVTALNFMGTGWVARNNYTACYPSNTDVKDYFIPVSRMFDYVGNTLIRTFWSKLDKPMTRRLIDTVLDTCNIWLAGLVGSEYLLGARAVMLESENPLTNLMAGIIKIHIYITPPSPAQEIDFTLEYDASYVESALAA